VLAEPSEGNRIIRSAPQDGFRYRHQRVQVERAGPAATDLGDRKVMAAGDRVAQLAGEDAGAAQGEGPRP
jgi:hypothetical protein